jgi:hypothetical protein
VVDAATARITDGGVSDRYPRLSKLGTVKTDFRRQAATHPSEAQRNPSMLPRAGCGSGKKAAALKLALRDSMPIRRLRVRNRAVVEVVSSFDRHRMTFPAAHPSNAVCEISRHRGRGGAAAARFRVVRPSTITFSSTYEQPTEAFMPAMLGRVIVTASTARPTS